MFRVQRVLRMVLALAALVVAIGAGQALRAAPSGASGLAGCVAVDASGSNFEVSDGLPPSDPGPVFQRAEAVNQLAGLMAADQPGASSKLSVVFFGSSTLEIDHAPVSTGAGRELLAQRVADISRTDLGWTRLTAGIERCIALLQAVAPPARRFLIVLSDFVAQDADPQFDFAAQSRAIEQTLVPALNQDQIRTYAIGYGQAVRQSDSQFVALMNALAEPTGGQAITLDPADPSLLLPVGQIAADLLGARFAPGQPRTGDAATPQTFSITIPSQTAEAVIIVEHPQDPTASVVVIDPAGTRFVPSAAATDWTSTPSFHQFRLDHPVPGTWQVLVQGKGSLRVDRWLAPEPAAAPTGTPTPAASATPAPTPVPAVVTAPTPSPMATPQATVAETATAAPVAVAATGGTTAGNSSGQSGGPFWLLIVVVIVVAAGLAAWATRRLVRPAPSADWGAFTIEDPSGDVREYELLDAASIVVGSGEGCELRLVDADVVEQHCELVAVETGLGRRTAQVRPLEGEVIRNGARVPSGGAALADGDTVRIGRTHLLYRNLGA